MTKVDIKRLDSVTKNDTTATERINDNFKALQEAIENTLSRDGTGPNYMDADLDMNSYRIINSSDPVEETDIVNLKYVEERIGGAVEASKTAVSAASQAASSAQSALVSSTNAINTLRNAEEQLNNTIEYVDEAKQSITDTINEALEDVKQQALDAAQESIDTAAEQATAIVIDYANNEVKPLLNEIASNAAESAENASESAGLAANESGNAAVSATDSQHYAEDSRIWAEGSDSEVKNVDGEHSSKGWANEAKSSADRAEKIAQGFDGVVNTIEGSIGDIGFAPLGIDEAQNKRRYLNGQVISQAQFKSFTNKIKSAIELYPNLATTETNWQAEVTNSPYGICGKFVIDDTLGTIRLPKYPDWSIREVGQAAVVGNGISLGLTDGASNYGLYQGNGPLGVASTAYGINLPSSGSNSGNPSYDKRLGVTTDPTKSGIIADLVSTNTEDKLQGKWFIQVATGTEESVDVTKEIELNNPFSLLDYKWSEYELNNASWLLSNGAFHSGVTYVAVYELLLKLHNGTETKDGVSVKLSTESYEDTDFVLNTSNTTFRLPIKVKLASGNAIVGDGINLGLTDGTNNIVMRPTDTYQNTALFHTGEFGLQVGTTTASGNTTSGKTLGVTTDPTKSGIETSSSGLKLYFYVGETIQDANVIVASGVLTAIANADYVVESYNDGTNWYRLYKSGWCEQGGELTSVAADTSTSVNLLKPYANTNYSVLITATGGKRSTTQFTNGQTVYSRTTTGFVMWTSDYSFGRIWQAKGYMGE